MIAVLVAGLIPISPAVEALELGARLTRSVQYSLMADVGTDDMPVLARTAKFAAVAKSTASGPVARVAVMVACVRVSQMVEGAWDCTHQNNKGGC